MKKSALLLIAVSLASAQAFSHSGRTDSSGGHNCSYKSQQKGLCTGYHYHGGLKIDDKGAATQVEPRISKATPKAPIAKAVQPAT
ncbi:MAG: YHYH domain-containing protein [Cellvibrionaceae bacterium]